MNTPNVKRAAIYARISEAKDNVDKVANQVDELRKFAIKNKYDVVEVFRDNDISAYKGKEVRPGFLALLDGLGKSKFDVVLATEISRLTRGSALENQKLLVMCSKSDAVIETLNSGTYDPQKSVDKAMLSFLDIFSGLESDIRIERQRARNRADLAAGMPTKGLRPFGWEPDRITIRESEARHVRDGFRMVLEDGKSSWAIAQHWNNLGIRTQAMETPRLNSRSGIRETPSGVWTTTAVSQILLRARNAGILMSKGAEMPRSQIQAIVSRVDFEDMKKRLTSSKMIPGPKPSYLLGGLLECPCGEAMYATSSNSSKKGKKTFRYKIYRCRLYGFDKKSKHVSIHRHIVDDYVSEVIVADIGLREFEPLIQDAESLRTAEARLNSVNEKYVIATQALLDGVGHRPTVMGNIAKLKDEIISLEGQVDSLVANSSFSGSIRKYVELFELVPDFPGEEELEEVLDLGRKAWIELPMENKRAIIKGKYRIVIKGGGRGGDRIQLSQTFAPPTV